MAERTLSIKFVLFSIYAYLVSANTYFICIYLAESILPNPAPLPTVSDKLL